MIVFFSGSGNTKHFVNALNEHLGETLVDLSRDEMPTDVAAETSLGIVFPIYCWGLPEAFKKRLAVFLKSANLNKDKLYTYSVCTCGDDIGTTEQELRRFLEQFGIVLNAIQSVKMPNTYVALPGFDVDNVADGKQKVQQTNAEIAALAGRIKARNTFRQTNPGALPFLKSAIIRPLFNRFWTSDKYYKVSDACTRCGKCAKVCPMNNISYDAAGKPVWHHNCAACLACYHACPANAISYNFTRGKGQYRLKKYL